MGRSSVQLLSLVQLFATPWTAGWQASLSITNSRILLKLMSTESVMPRNHLILYCPLLLLPSIFPSIRVFSNESILHIRWPKYWSFSFSIKSFQWIFRTNFLQNGLVWSPCCPRDSQESSPTPQFKSINSSALSFLSFFLFYILKCFIHRCMGLKSSEATNLDNDIWVQPSYCVSWVFFFNFF